MQVALATDAWGPQQVPRLSRIALEGQELANKRGSTWRRPEVGELPMETCVRAQEI